MSTAIRSRMVGSVTTAASKPRVPAMLAGLAPSQPTTAASTEQPGSPFASLLARAFPKAPEPVKRGQSVPLREQARRERMAGELTDSGNEYDDLASTRSTKRRAAARTIFG